MNSKHLKMIWKYVIAQLQYIGYPSLPHSLSPTQPHHTFNFPSLSSSARVCKCQMRAFATAAMGVFVNFWHSTWHQAALGTWVATEIIQKITLNRTWQDEIWKNMTRRCKIWKDARSVNIRRCEISERWLVAVDIRPASDCFSHRLFARPDLLFFCSIHFL